MKFLPTIAAGLATFIGVTIDEHALIPVGGVLATMGIVFWVGRTLQRVTDGQESLKAGQDQLAAGQKAIWDRIDRLPCRQPKCASEQEP